MMSESSNPDTIIANYNNETTTNNFDVALTKDTGVNFINDQMNKDLTPDLKLEGDKEENKDENKGRYELLEYLLGHNGSVICKICGEVLRTRTHWYRHKYKHHVPQPMQPEPLFQCERCLAYFKSRKGHLSHVQSKHHELLSDSNPVLTSTVTEPFTKEQQTQVTELTELFKEEPDPELLIPKTSVLNYQTNVVKHVAKSTETKKYHRNKEQNFNQAEWEEKRSREEKLVIGIIERVRREYASLPSAAAPARRRGYGRRSS